MSMGAVFSSAEPSTEVKDFVDCEIRNNKVVIFSKTYCSYCRMAKGSLDEVGAEFKAIELDRRKDGNEIQHYLTSLTGGSTVPRVFINGKCVGGGTETKSLQRSGKLIKLINGEA